MSDGGHNLRGRDERVEAGSPVQQGAGDFDYSRKIIPRGDDGDEFESPEHGRDGSLPGGL